MPEYQLYYIASASYAVKVEADDLESAIEAGYDELPGGVCAQCSGWGQRWCLDLGEFEIDEKAAAEDYPS